MVEMWAVPGVQPDGDEGEGGEMEGHVGLCRSRWGVLDYILGVIGEPPENF